MRRESDKVTADQRVATKPRPNASVELQSSLQEIQATENSGSQRMYQQGQPHQAVLDERHVNGGSQLNGQQPAQAFNQQMSQQDYNQQYQQQQQQQQSGRQQGRPTDAGPGFVGEMENMSLSNVSPPALVSLFEAK